MQNVWKTSDDPTRCDWSIRNPNLAVPYAGDVTNTDPVAGDVPMIITQPVSANPLTQLSRRETFNGYLLEELRSSYCITEFTGRAPLARDYCHLQDDWDKMIAEVKLKCSDKFWSLFLSVHTFSGVYIDTTLAMVKRLFLQPKTAESKMFASTRRQLKTKMQCVKNFWERVRHTKRIDLVQFQLPSRVSHVNFHFIDPVWGWLMAARRQEALHMHWKPFAHAHDHGLRAYGGGIQCGECFAHAYKKCPKGSYNMMVSLHWDGTHGHGMGCVPIAVGVGNTNCCDSSKEFCIGYIPTVPDQSQPFFKDSVKGTR